MSFFKTSFMIMIVVLIICLTFVGVSMNQDSDTIIYPPTLSNCPDHFKLTSDGETCESEYFFESDGITKISISALNKNGNPGTGKSSELCDKKDEAMDKSIDWDGITNNPYICYSRND